MEEYSPVSRIMAPSDERVPAPDPTRLTTAQLYREITALREYFDIQILALQQGLGAMHTDQAQIPARIDEKIQAAIGETRFLKELFTERFAAIATQFTNLDAGRMALAAASAENFRTAMAAYKELMTQQNTAFSQATAKAEQSTGTRVAQLEALVEAKIKALEQRLELATTRLMSIEGGNAGQRLERADRDNNSRLMMTIIATIGGVIMVGLALFLRT